MATTADVEKVVDKNRRKIEMITGPFYHSGMTIWTTQEIADEGIDLEVHFLNKPFSLKITTEHKLAIAPIGDDQVVRERNDYQAYSQILNIIMNKAMSSVEGMVAFGRRPRFFDYTKPINVEGLDIAVWEGFKTSAYMYNSGCVLIIDSCHRFMSTKSIMDVVDSIYDEVEHEF